jgi:hypothetical protein
MEKFDKQAPVMKKEQTRVKINIYLQISHINFTSYHYILNPQYISYFIVFAHPVILLLSKNLGIIFCSSSFFIIICLFLLSHSVLFPSIT